jgi:hypothetical protein
MTLPVRRHFACVLEIEPRRAAVTMSTSSCRATNSWWAYEPVGTNPQPHYRGLTHSSLRDGTETDHDQPWRQ